MLVKKYQMRYKIIADILKSLLNDEIQLKVGVVHKRLKLNCSVKKLKEDKRPNYCTFKAILVITLFRKLGPCLR